MIIQDLTKVTKQYRVLYADPPWEYKVWSDKGTGRSASQHYKVHNVDLLANQIVPREVIDNITNEYTVLFLWATYPNIKDALTLLEAWGFKYSTVAFTWVKRNRLFERYSIEELFKDPKKLRHYLDYTITKPWFWGTGHSTRANAEIVLLGTRKELGVASNSVHSIVEEPISPIHSEKPNEVRRRIKQLMGGNAEYLELFARHDPPGWDVWGNEAGKYPIFD